MHGVHKLDKGFFDALGVNTDVINPKKIKVYGHGGQSLPLVNNGTHEVADDILSELIKRSDG